ncbi:SpoIIE family protein phosphatase [Marinagarivorans algicola]|uniref:SpoIIE family protein phosphatase n=1 Tax=Marinagarivorans algicola TaxID=1513270 RepID=UPI0006B40E0D|nr:SpoIIE family protein phosphatase [Marinagarivorans algicola]
MKILIADDHSYNRELLNFILEDEGHECIDAENGKLAIDVYSRDPDIQLILMDVNMPVMDGIEATKIIKAKAAQSKTFVTVIFVTALDNADVLVQCLDAGGDDFVPKPINENILLSKLKAHSRNQAMYDSLKAAKDDLEYHQRLMDREHRIVEHIFANDVGLSETSCENVESYTSPASLFNGDLLLTAPSPAGGVYVLVGDFTGHGLSAAVGSLPVSSIFYDSAAKQESVSYIVRLMNTRLRRLLPDGMFFCAALLYLEPLGERLQVWAGGMNDMLCRCPDADQLMRIVSQHMPLGIMEDDEFDHSLELYELPVHSKLYIYTDGINEAKDIHGNELGLARVEETVLQSTCVIDDLVTQVRQFTQGCEQADDVSVLALTLAPVKHIENKTGAYIDVGADYRNAQSFAWELDMRLAPEDLRSSDIVLQIGKFLGTIQGIELHQDKIFTIISELYSNALEHGVLQLSSKLKSSPDGFDEYYRLRAQRLSRLKCDAFVKVKMAYIRSEQSAKMIAESSVNKLLIVISDSGNGFDYASLEGFSSLGQGEESCQDNDKSHGRGLSLLKTFCESLTYSDGGRTATAVYPFY